MVEDLHGLAGAVSERVAITTTTFGESDDAPLRILAEAGYQAVANPLGRALKAGEPAELCSGCVGIVAGTERYGADTLRALRDGGLRAISRVGAGMDAIDLAAAAALGIPVRNTPFGPTQAVAELTVALIMDMLRHVSWMDREMRGGTWKKRTGRLIAGRRVGIIGFGRIGRRVSELLSALGAEVAYCDVAEQPDDGGCTPMEAGDLLAWADIVSVHCSAEAGCGTLVGAREISLMRDGALIVNTSRGNLVDEAALAEALSAGKLAGAAVDVFGQEPYSGRLTGIDSVVLTPHVGSYALESRIQMEIDAVANLLEELDS